MNTNPDLSSKVILITGASSGIGEATARLLAAHGAAVVLGARRTDRLEKLVAEIQAAGGRAAFRALDVTSAADTKAFVDFAVATFGRIDVLFNNAGVMPLSRLDALEVDQWDNMIDVNIKGVLYGIAAALPRMEAQGHGQIINTASVAAHMVMSYGAVYCGTKYAVWAISDGLRQETKKVRVTVISPGVTTTELGHDIRDPQVKGFVSDVRHDSLTSEDIAATVLFAVSQPPHVDISEIIARPLTSSL